MAIREHMCYEIFKHMVALAMKDKGPFNIDDVKLVLGVLLAGHQSKLQRGKELVLM